MPRAKPRTGQADFSAKKHALDGATRTLLVKFLRLGSAYDEGDIRHKNAIGEVEKWLGFYKPARETAGNLPRPADYKRAIAELDRNGLHSMRDGKFHQRIQDSVARIRDLPGNAGMSDEEIAAEVRRELAVHAKGDARGRLPKDYYYKLVKELRKTFQRYYVTGPHKNEATVGCIVKLSEQEFDEDQFLEEALRGANISYPEKLRRLYINPAVALPHERNRVLDAAASKRAKSLKSEDKPE